MRILLVSHGFPPTVGGVESHMWDLAHHLAQRGHEVTCLAGTGAPPPGESPVALRIAPELAAERLLGRRPDGTGTDPALFGVLRTVFGAVSRDVAPDLVHAHNLHRFAPEAAAALLAVATAPVLHTVHDVVSDSTCPDVLGLPWAHTVFVSRHLADGLRTAVTTPWSVIPVGLDCARFRDPGPVHPFIARLERPIILHPARLLRWKGPLVGLRAFIEVRRALRRGSLVLCESPSALAASSENAGLSEEMAQLATRAGVADSVHYRQFSRAEMPAALRGADLVWYPTTGDEALGLAPIEAMAAGRAVVVSDSGGLTEGVVPERSGLRVPRGSHPALARAALRVLADDELRRRLSAAGPVRAARFDNALVVARLTALYAGLVPAGRPAAYPAGTD